MSTRVNFSNFQGIKSEFLTLIVMTEQSLLVPVFICILAFYSAYDGYTRVHITQQSFRAHLNPLCYGFIECCYHRWSYTHHSSYKFGKALDDNLFGQHLARDTIYGAIQGHLYNLIEAEKPLVLSLHGPAGTGKNHISRLLVESIFTRGMSSSFVTVKISTKDYPHKELIQQYKRELVELVTSKVSSCPLLPVFIFDEIEHMPPDLLDSIKMFMDNHPNIEGIDYRRSIFIFRSNLAATAITNYVLDQYKEGRAREDITLKEMEQIIRKDVVSKANTGLYNAKIINSHLISHFVPFLPLETKHVRQCIREEFWKIGRLPYRVEEDEVLAQLEFFGPPSSKLFAVKGCKNVAEKVNVILYKQLRENYKRENSEL